MKLKLIALLILSFPTLAFAEVSLGSGSTLGFAASNINSIVAFIYSVLDVILYVGAAIMGMSGLLKYRLHRQNPQQVPLSTPVTELAIAGILVLLAVLTQLSASYKTVDNPNLPNGAPKQQQNAAPVNTYPY